MYFTTLVDKAEKTILLTGFVIAGICGENWSGKIAKGIFQ
jgi:hypothetical protein